jgi:hypothetical protein
LRFKADVIGAAWAGLGTLNDYDETGLTTGVKVQIGGDVIVTRLVDVARVTNGGRLRSFSAAPLSPRMPAPTSRRGCWRGWRQIAFSYHSYLPGERDRQLRCTQQTVITYKNLEATLKKGAGETTKESQAKNEKEKEWPEPGPDELSPRAGQLVRAGARMAAGECSRTAPRVRRRDCRTDGRAA